MTCPALRALARWIFSAARVVGPALLLTTALLGAGAPERKFDLPAGNAADTLKDFSRQSGEELIFPVDQVRSVKTNRVSGTLRNREALELMLRGTGLDIVQDQATGALAVRLEPAAAAADTGRVVLLPPFFVEEPRLSRPPWRHAELPGMEFISCCDEDTTLQLIERTYHLNQRLEEFLPGSLRLDLAMPTTFVLYGEAQQPVDFREIVGEIPRVAHPLPGGSYVSTNDVTVHYLPNFRFYEPDELTVFFIVKQDVVGSGNIYLNSAYIRYLLEHRTPPLPRWFIEGMMALYQNSSLEVEPLYWGSAGSALAARTAARFSYSSHEPTASVLPYGATLVRLPRWMFGRRIRPLLDRDSHWRPRLLPMAEFFTSPPPPTDGNPPGTEPAPNADKDARFALWWSQSALFLHWALARDNGHKRAELWEFVHRASTGPVTESLFREFFGLDYHAMDEELASYLTGAVRTTLHMTPQGPPDLPRYLLRPATETEISRIKGNLERLETAYVKEKFSGLAPKYLARARHTLREAFDKGARDPGLLEVIGLCECDAGDDAAAQPYLELAVQGGAVRPRAFYELARIKYENLLAQNAAVRFGTRPATELLELLFAARAQSPPLPEVYELIALVWQRSTAKLSRANLAVLDEGIDLFPDDLRLIYFAAALNASHGFEVRAASLIKLGLERAPAGPERERFRQLQSTPAAPDRQH